MEDQYEESRARCRETHLYRKKPVVIKAMQVIALPVDSTEREPLLAWLGAECDDWVQLGDGSITIATLEGEMTASPGDWIIRGVKGEFYPCKPDIFQATYESA